MLPCLKAKGKKKRKDSRNRPWHVESGALELPKLSLQPARPRRSMVAFTKTSRAVRHSTSNEENCLVENLETYKLISHTRSKLAWLAHFLQSPELWFRFAQAKTTLPLHPPEHRASVSKKSFDWAQDLGMNVWNAPSSGAGTATQHFRESAKAEPRSPYRSADPAIPGSDSYPTGKLCKASENLILDSSHNSIVTPMPCPDASTWEK